MLAGELAAVDAAGSGLAATPKPLAGEPRQRLLVTVSQLFADALATALDAAELTDGDVDPTCGQSLVRLGYDRDFAGARRRTGPLRQPPRPAGGWRSVDLDPAPALTVSECPPASCSTWAPPPRRSPRTARRPPIAGRRLGGGVLVNLGGDLRVAGGHTSRTAGGSASPTTLGFDGSGAWLIPTSQAVMITGGGLATSGPAVRSWQRGTARFHHIIVPSTGLPAQSCWRGVSVAAATCVDANIASTAAIIRSEQATGWLAGLGLPARLVRHDGEAVTVAGWPGGHEDQPR